MKIDRYVVHSTRPHTTLNMGLRDVRCYLKNNDMAIDKQEHMFYNR